MLVFCLVLEGVVHLAPLVASTAEVIAMRSFLLWRRKARHGRLADEPAVRERVPALDRRLALGIIKRAVH